MLTSDSTNYVMLMTFHRFLLICELLSQSLLILRKALRGEAAVKPFAGVPEPQGQSRVDVNCTEGFRIRHGACKDGLPDRRGHLGHFPTTGLWQLPVGTTSQLWLCCHPMKYLMCQACGDHGFLFQVYPLWLLLHGESHPSFWGIDGGLFKRKV